MNSTRRADPLVIVSSSAFLALAALAVISAETVSEVLMRVSISAVSTLGFCEALLHLAGYTTCLRQIIPLRLLPRLPKTGGLLSVVLAFAAGTAVYALVARPAFELQVLPTVLSVLAAYGVARAVSYATSRGLAARIAAASVVVAAFSAVSPERDLRYLEAVVRLLEEVIRLAL